MRNCIHDDALVVHLTVKQIKEIIESVFQQSSSLSSEKSSVIDLEEVAKLTGYKKATIYKLIHERKIPFHQPAHGGRRKFFKLAEIEQWLQSKRIETNEDFFRNHGSKKSKTHGKMPSQQWIKSLKSLRQLFIFFLNVINQYKAQIQRLEEKIAKYEADNQMIENLFIYETFNTTKNGSKK